MFTLNFKAAIAASWVVIGCANTASAVDLYTCDMTDIGNHGWLSPVVVVGHDSATGEVLVHDAIIYAFNDEKPLFGEVSVENEKRISFTWRLKDRVTSRTNQYVPSFMYRLTVIKKNGKATIYAKPGGYDDNFRGRGTCTKGAK